MMTKILLVIVINLLMIQSSIVAQIVESKKLNQPGEKLGLIFSNRSTELIPDSSYSEVIQLLKLGKKAQAIQFKISVNKSLSDSTILIFEEIQKGPDLIDPAWLLDFNIIRGQTLKNGASKDDVQVVLYNLNQDGGLMPGDYFKLFVVNYKVAVISGTQNNIKSSMTVSNAQASTFNGFPIDIEPSHSVFEVVVKAN